MSPRHKPPQRVAPLHVALVGDYAGVNGGSARVMIESALGLAAAGVRASVVAGAGEPDPRLAAAGIEVAVAPPRAGPSRAAGVFWNAAAGRLVAERLAALPRGRTVVHLHSWGKELSGAAVRAIRASGHPGVVTLHDYLSVCPNGTFYDFRKEAICRRAPMSGACLRAACDGRSYAAKLARVARQALTDRLGRLFEACPDVISISRTQEDAVRPYLPPGVRVRRVDNPIACVDLGPREAPADGPFLFVGRLVREKDPAILAEAGRVTGLPVAFVGDGPEAAAIVATNPRASLLGWAPQAAVREAMRGARALVFPSRWYEGQGLTTLEALSLGLPAIVSDACSSREAIEDGETGLLFRAGVVSSLAAAMRRIAEDEAFARRLSRAAYDAFWRDPPDLAAHVSRLVPIYEAALARRAGAPLAAA